jgi:hypothetical protein
VEVDAMRLERIDLLAGAAEHHGIAALQPCHALAIPGESDDQRVDLGLGERVVPLLLAHQNALGIAPTHLDGGGRHKMIVDDNIGLLQQPLRPQRQQILGARPCPDQPDDARAVALGHVLVEQRFGLGRTLAVQECRLHFG